MVQVQSQSNRKGTGLVLDLRDADAADAARAGAKAAKLARAAAHGMPVLPGFVIACRTTPTPDGLVELYDVWQALSDYGELPLVVRSSSTAEDGDTSSMAGRFESVIDVRGWPAFLDAVERVRQSAGEAPMAVLVQPLLTPSISGVLFGADPVTGDVDRTVIAVVDGAPHRLVSGQTEGTYHVLNRHGRLVDVRPGEGGAVLTAVQRRALHRLAHRLERRFGGPQDVEWAWDADQGLVLLQTRPITAGVDRRNATGPRWGPGPAAETFPEPLAPLEEDLWLDPLDAGLRQALALTGVASARRLRRGPVVRTVLGRAVVDLDVLGVAPPRHPWLHRFDPRPPGRRVRAAWRVGRLRAALPLIADDVLSGVDRLLADVPPLTTLDDRQLLGLLERVGQALTSAHAYEVLLGLVLRMNDDTSASAAGEALRAVAEGRAEGLSDTAIVERDPLVLALTAPRIGRTPTLPATDGVRLPPAGTPTSDDPAALREALRLRARWLHELSARAAAVLGQRMGIGNDVALLTHAELRQANVPDDLASRRRPTTPPLPDRFRLTPEDEVVADDEPANAGGGTGAGGGRAEGVAFHVGDGATPPDGSVLIVQALEPTLAGWLPSAAAVVSETGSPLSHLAILAREMGVAVVVGVPGARAAYPDGTRMAVDGRTGEVTVL